MTVVHSLPWGMLHLQAVRGLVPNVRSRIISYMLFLATLIYQFQNTPLILPHTAIRGIKMVTVYDVPAEQLILRTAQKLKENSNIVPPEWAEFAKTGRHTERAPSQDDWWYTRAASILRKLYVKGPMGSSKLAAEYGGYADKGSMPNKAVKGSRNIARKCMQQLEAAGFLVSKEKEGRSISPSGQSLLDNAAKEVYDEMKA